MSEAVEKKPVALGEFILAEVTEPGERKIGSLYIPANTSDDGKPALMVVNKGPDVKIDVEKGDQIEVVDMPRINYFLGQKMEKLALIHQKYIAATYK
jgi:hypothetical protein